MRVKSRKTGINYLCDTIILPQYYNFERDAEYKTDFENFKEIGFDCWNIFIAAYFVCALQIPMSSMKSRAYNKLMKSTLDYFKEQYPLFPRVLKTFLNTFKTEDPSGTEMGTLLVANLLQRNEDQISINDINMGCEIADTIFNLASVIDVEELTDYCSAED